MNQVRGVTPARARALWAEGAHPNVGVLQKLWEAVAEQDREAFDDVTDPEILVTIGGASCLSGAYAGRAQVWHLVEKVLALSHHAFFAEPLDIAASASRAMVLVRAGAARQQLWYTSEFVLECGLADERVHTIRLYVKDPTAFELFWNQVA